jgi:hypothetical protein
MTDRKFCHAQKKSDGKPCERPAGWGTDHVGVGRCKLHGGATPGASRREFTEAQAVMALTRLGHPVPIDPASELLNQVSVSAARVKALAYQYELLSDDGSQRARDKVLGQWNNERERLMKACKWAIEAGIARRQVELAERQGTVMVGIISNVLVKLGLPREVQQQARVIIAGEFSRVAEEELAVITAGG